MKVAFLCPALPGARVSRRHTLSGGTRYDVELCDALQTIGTEIEFLQTPVDASSGETERLATHLRESGVSVVLQDALGFGAYTRLNRRLRRRSGAPRLVAVVHVPTATLFPELGSASAERAYLQTVDGFIAPSLAAHRAAAAVADCERPGAVVAPGISRPPRALSTAQFPLSFFNREPHLIAVGHVSPAKRYLDLIDVLGHLHRAHPSLDWRMTIAGRLDVDRDYVRAVRWRIRHHRLQNRVRLAGALDQLALWNLYRTATLNLNTSAYESWGMALADGLTMGVPFASWAEGGLWELSASPRVALRVPPGDVATFAEVIATNLGRSLHTRISIGTAAVRSSEALTDWRRAAESCLRFLATVCELPPRRGGATTKRRTRATGSKKSHNA